MEKSGELGLLITSAGGDSRLLPLEFTQIDGVWWAEAPLDLRDHLARCDGQPANVIFLNDQAPTVNASGMLLCSYAPEDRHRLADACTECHIGAGPVVKIIPEDDETPNHQHRKAA